MFLCFVRYVQLLLLCLQRDAMELEELQTRWQPAQRNWTVLYKQKLNAPNLFTLGKNESHSARNTVKNKDVKRYNKL